VGGPSISHWSLRDFLCEGNRGKEVEGEVVNAPAFTLFMISYHQFTVFTKMDKYNQDAKVTLKGIVHPKMKIRSSFTHPQVVPNMYEFLSSTEQKKIF